MLLRHFAEQQNLLEQQKADMKLEKSLKVGNTDSKSLNYPHGYKNHALPTTTTSSSSGLKQEPNFSLYGYQPFQHSYITTDQLKTLEKQKEEKMNIDSKNLIRSSSPKRSVPPPLIKDSKPHSSVIVENKVKEGNKSSSPRPAHSHYSSTVPLSQSPRQQPKPAHTPDRHTDRPMSALSSSSPIAAHSEQSMDLSSSGSQISSLRAAESKHISSRSQSPLHIASPHQLSAAIQQPVDYHRGGGKTRTSPADSNKSPISSSNSPSGSGSHYVSAAIAQPPVSLPPSSVTFTYSLIQQGLVPNPIYSQNTVKAAPAALNEPQKSAANSLAGISMPLQDISTSSHGTNSMAGQPGKRKINKEGNHRKRQKVATSSANTAGAGLSIPVTTPEILTNHSPYTTASSSAYTSLSSVTSSTPSSMSNVVSSSSVSSSSSAPSVTSPSFITSGGNVLHGTSGFMDSFKSFVENAVQNAYFQDQEFSRQKNKSQHNPGQGHSTPPQQPLSQTSPQQQQQSQNKTKDVMCSSSSALPVNEDSTLSLSNSSVSSHTAVMDTINRVANGQVDTDSDTLSAPSPPPQFKSDNSSPHKSANHPKLKKAWLQRHSDEDKELKNLPESPDDDKSAQKEEIVRNCFVNCSYISPCKEGGSKSPISALRLPNGNMKELGMDDESTTSASETESQVNYFIILP